MSSENGLNEKCGTFDIDVVGIPNLNEFRHEGDFFDFDSGEEYGLFGGDGVPLQQGPTFPLLPSGDKEDIASCSSSIIKCDKPSSSTKVSKGRHRKSKEWNDIEKDLFHKGLDMFGYHWRKISKFIATKTAYQVKVYYNQWSETANVIHESENLISDSCIYLSQEDNGYLSLNDSSVAAFHKGKQDDVKESEVQRNECIKVECENELVVSSLNDWSLGSQVSVANDEFNDSLELETDDSSQELVISEEVYSSRKRKPNNKRQTNSRLKKIKPEILVDDSDRNIIGMPKPRLDMNQGQVIRLIKTAEDEETDVDIDDSDDNGNSLNISEEVSLVESTESLSPKGSQKEAFMLLSKDEEALCSRLWPNDINAGRCTLLDIKNGIVNCWKQNNCKFLSLARVLSHLKHVKESKQIISHIFDYLEKKSLINSFKDDVKSNNDGQSHVRRRRNRKKESKKEINDNFKGGITISHDRSGAVVDALRVPERSAAPSSGKKIPHVKLKNYMTHNTDAPAPFAPVIHPLAFVTLDMHAHSSYSEVMGLLGGYLDHSSQTLYIDMAVPTKAKSSGVSCDMCPIAQIEATESIHKGGGSVVGWYHSHPTFLPNPSDRDILTQSQFQTIFNLNDIPFVGLIISPFYFTEGSDSSLIRCMILDKPNFGQLSHRFARNVPFRLCWSINKEIEIEEKEIDFGVRLATKSVSELEPTLQWLSEYKGGRTFVDKLTSSLNFHLPKKLRNIVSTVKKIVVSS